MDPDGSLWIPMDPHGSRWIPMDPDGSLWIPMDPCGSRWIPMDPCVDVLERVPGKNLAVTNIYVLLRGPSGQQVLPKLTLSFAFVGLVLQKCITG